MDLNTIWNEFLVRPVFNILIWIYNEMAEENLGAAVLLLTVGLRFILLPFSILTIQGKRRVDALQKKLKALTRDFKGDRVAIKEELRRVMKQYKLHPWAKAVSLGAQALMLLILYQVFLNGLRGEVIVHQLYAWVDLPARLNTQFVGFDIGVRNVFWALAVGIILFVEIYLQNRKRKKVSQHDLWFSILFPLASFAALYMLPMVKSLFILTSMMFTFILMLIQRVLIPPAKVDKVVRK